MCVCVGGGGGGRGQDSTLSRRVFSDLSRMSNYPPIYIIAVCVLFCFLSLFLLLNSGSQLCLRCLVSVFCFFLCFCSFTYLFWNEH